MTLRTVWVLFLGAFTFLLSGCGGVAAPEPRTFDLGLEGPGVRMPVVRLGSVRAMAPFDTADMQYRLAYRNAGEIAAFANSRWAATPAEMFRKQLLRASGDGAGKCTLDIDLQEFSQVFSAKEASDARIDLRVTVRGGSARSLSMVEPNAGPDAQGGAAALSRAVNRAVGEIGAWIAAQPGCS
jgi:cholesterol transport system auxiliary component